MTYANPTPTWIGVVVPFFQQSPGLLRKCLLSVLGQHLPDNTALRIVVVDDDSPCDPRADLDGLAVDGRNELVLLKQGNAGPGAARNAALDYLDRHPVDYVAFIDSDDVWLSHHIKSALRNLGDQNDYYFADHRRDYNSSDGASYFRSNPTVQDWLRDPLVGPFELTDTPGTFLLRESWGIRPFMLDYLSQTSTVVYRHSPLRKLRFDPTLRIAGEDLLFWMQLAQGSRRVCLSAEVDVLCEQGINIFHSTLTWDHPNAPARFAYQLMLWRYVADRFELSAAERAITRIKIAGFGRGFSYIWLRALLKTGRANPPLLSMLGGLGWRSWRIAPNVAAVVLRKVMQRPLFPEH